MREFQNVGLPHPRRVLSPAFLLLKYREIISLRTSATTTLKSHGDAKNQGAVKAT